ncbi:hypothetical protein [Clostridium cylindrosporum]|uniref:HesB-like selenoprotein n=1 Tax=Clostridium cylindrosporum DSM 605 TaxID=1121307 RepID=A0A0J8DF95_CLOCY|nr:hypothetical protein [Clostridium cylindrosporum]KMT22848.1 hypothetical protein CLCY_5c00870 [Clostridium cylindrosporum DSM 605]
MNIRMDNETSKALKQELSNKDKEYGIKVDISTISCGGPILSVSLCEKNSPEEFCEVNGIKVFLDEGLDKYTDSIEISKNDKFGGGFSATYGDGCSACNVD